MASLIDGLLPEPDVAMRHQRRVAASPRRLYEALHTANLGGAPLIALLFALRALPALLVAPRATLRRLRGRRQGTRWTLAGLLVKGFAVVAERQGEEIVLATVGRFWKATGELRPASRETFRTGPPAGEALVAWNFRVDPAPGGGSVLSTETRIRCADPGVLRVFRRYWTAVRPGSALIRRMMLRRIAREAARTP